MNPNLHFPIPQSTEPPADNSRHPEPTLKPDSPITNPASSYARTQVNRVYNPSSSQSNQSHSAPQNQVAPNNLYPITSIPGYNSTPIQKVDTNNPDSYPPGDTQNNLSNNQTTSNQLIPNEPYNLNQHPLSGAVESSDRTIADLKKQILNNIRTPAPKTTHRLRSWIWAVFAGLVFILISYNEIAVAQIKQYISPGSSLTTPLIINSSANLVISPEPRIMIPKINVDVPVVYGINGYDEKLIQKGLEQGVVHYGNTALPGQDGNIVIVGHSSNNFFNSGQYKFAFVLLDQLNKDDTFILNYQGQRYVYKIFNKQIIEPNDFSLIGLSSRPIATLITCTPPGTSWKRLVVQGEQILPNPAEATKNENKLPDNINTPIPGNAPSFWQSVWSWFN